MRTCQTCGGAVASPLEVTGFAGMWCTCPAPAPRPDAWEEIRRKAIDEIDKRGGIGLAPQKVVFVPDPPKPAPPMTAQEFVFWLAGYFAAYGGDPRKMAQGDWVVIAAKFNTLGGPK